MMTHHVLCGFAALLVAVSATVLPLRAGAAEEGPGIPGARNQSAQALPAEAPGRAKRDTYPFRGTIGTVDLAAKTLVLEGKQSRRTIQLTPQTRYERSGDPISPEELKPGEMAGGMLRKTGDGREEAVLIRIGPKPESSTRLKRTSPSARDAAPPAE